MVETVGPEGLNNEDTRFAAAMKRERERRGWNQTELAERLRRAGLNNFHQNTVSRIEKNERVVKMSEAYKIATVLGTTVGAMVSVYVPQAERLVQAMSDAKTAESNVIAAHLDHEAARTAVGAASMNVKDWVDSEPPELENPETRSWVGRLLQAASEVEKATPDSIVSRYWDERYREEHGGDAL